MKKVVLSDKLYIPISLYNELSNPVKRRIKDEFTKTIFDPHLCEVFSQSLKCKKLDKYGQKACRKCPKGRMIVKQYKLTKKFFSVDRGDKDLIHEIIQMMKSERKIKVVDRTSYEKFPKERKFKIYWNKLEGDRKEEQLRVCKNWNKKGYGQIIAPPRSGKTVIGVILSNWLKTRTAIIIHQKELLDQFYNSFYTFTNIREKEEMLGHPLIEVNPKPKDVESRNVCLYTWQQFLSKKHGKDRLKDVRDKFGFIIIDESHRSCSKQYSNVISRFKAKYRCGLTATPTRRDQLQVRSNLILGPPLIEGGSEQLSCLYSFVDTDFVVPNYKRWGTKEWNFLWKKLCEDTERNKLILSYIKKDLKKGRKIIIPVKRVAHANTLVNMLNKKEPFKKGKYKAVSYVGGVKNRDTVTDDIKKGKYDVVVATKQMISLGFDAPPMDCLYSNVGGPVFDPNNFYQEYSRIRTKYENKKKPLIRVFIDDGDICSKSANMMGKEFQRLKFKRIKGDEKNKKERTI